jgi:hypothetical protein
MIVPGGGISSDGSRWIACRPGFFLPVRVLSRLFRRLFIEKLLAAHEAGRLKFFTDHTSLAEPAAFRVFLAPMRKQEWVVYAKPPFGGPEAVLAYLSRYTHRVAISNSRLIRVENGAVTFTCKDYRLDGAERYKSMSLPVHEFIRRFLMHVLPKRFHRIRHYGLFANGNRVANIARARELLNVQPTAEAGEAETAADGDGANATARPCGCCGGRMIIIEVFEAGCQPKHRPTPEAIDSS